jgi:hypothetical protein
MGKWIRRQWRENTNFRHAVSILVVVGLQSAGIPAALSQALGGIIGAAGV